MAQIASDADLHLESSHDDCIRRVLVVDDSRVQRKILSSSLKRWGYEVFQADSGKAALQICCCEDVDLIISDWVMPGMNGVDFCVAFRAMERDAYGYFILLTTKSEKNDVAHGLDLGADDFLTKPVNADELRARIAAGQRILRMERELKQKNNLISATLKELQKTQDIIDRDLLEAKKLQQSLVRDRYREFETADISLILRPSGHVGGDLVGMFPISDSQIGFFGIDVSGHGITSALMAARLAGYLSGSSPDQNVALQPAAGGGYESRSPAAAVTLLNSLCLDEMSTEHYFTLLLGYIDLESGTTCIAQAGHPYPVLQRADGSTHKVGTGGLPVGLIPDADYDEFRVILAPGDRLLFPSDGLTEFPMPDGEMLDDDGLHSLLKEHRDLRGERLLETILQNLSDQNPTQEFPDDVSAVLVEFNGPRDC